MDLIHAIILGVVQGLTEFLPISSSGHLIVFPHVFGWIQQPLAFDTTLHLGTAVALVVYFFKDLLKIAVVSTSLILKVITYTISITTGKSDSVRWFDSKNQALKWLSE